MVANIISFIVGIIALVGAGIFSYLQFGLSEPRIAAPTTTPVVVVVPKKVSPTSVAKTPTETTVETPAKVVPKQDEPKASPTQAPVPTNGSLVTKTPTTVQNVVEPGPLRITVSPSTPTGATLSVRGVIEYTNGARSLNGGLPALIENSTLDRDAQIKLEDMFAKQYFEHESPTGVGPSDIAKAVGYNFVIVGENLALGDFGSDEKLVEAWMNSPGHRANILNEHYEEIGVAVGKGLYDGRMTWLAVQAFGMPLSSCPAIDAQKKAQIDINNLEVTSRAAILEKQKAFIEALPANDPNYNTYVNEFNALVQPYNALVVDTRTMVVEYNLTVQAFNNCIAVAGTATH